MGMPLQRYEYSKEDDGRIMTHGGSAGVLDQLVYIVSQAQA